MKVISIFNLLAQIINFSNSFSLKFFNATTFILTFILFFIASLIPLITLSPEWEQNFAESLVNEGEERQLSMAPSKLQEFISTVKSIFERVSEEGEIPVLLTSPSIRPFVRSIIERFRPSTIVLSQNEIHPKAKLKTLDQI